MSKSVLLWMAVGIVPIAILLGTLMYFYGPQENTNPGFYSGDAGSE